MNKIILVAVMATFFSMLAGKMAYIITYSEYEHHYPTKKEPRKIAFEMGMMTFSVFFVLSLIIVYLTSKIY